MREQQTSRHTPWLRYRDTGLHVVPSVHNRQVFAQLVYEACRAVPFEVVAVELAGSYARLGFLDSLKKLRGFPGVVLRVSPGEPQLAEVPVDEHPDSTDTEERPVKLGAACPIVPCDSIMMALRSPELLRKVHPGWRPEVRFVDAETDPGARSAPKASLAPLDDYEVILRGLDAFYARWEEHFQRARIEEPDGRRERWMARELLSLLQRADRPRVLFVCGAAHWQEIRRMLDVGLGFVEASKEHELFIKEAPNTPDEAQGEDPEAPRLVLCPIQPKHAWLSGWLDDIPRVAWAFEERCRAGRGTGFDKRLATEKVLLTAVRQAQEANVAVSTRQIEGLARFRETLMACQERLLPRLGEDWLRPAVECVGQGFARVVKETALQYPDELPPGLEFPRFQWVDEDRLYMQIGDERFLLDVERGDAPSDGGWVLPIPPPLSREERRSIRESDTTQRRHTPEERVLHQRLARRARDLAHRKNREQVSRPFHGDFGLGLAWRPTIRARAAGRRTVYVRESKRSRTSACDGTCPIVWIFDPDARIDHNHTIGVFDPDTDRQVFCDTLLWCSRGKHFGEVNVTRRWIAYSVSLTTGLFSTWGPDAGRDIRRFLDEYPEHRRCKRTPWSDPQFRAFQGHERAIACAVRYAQDHVLVVALPEVTISAELANYARERNVAILRVSRDHFDRDALGRLALYHSVPRPGSFELPYPWVYRYVLPTGTHDRVTA